MLALPQDKTRLDRNPLEVEFVATLWFSHLKNNFKGNSNFNKGNLNFRTIFELKEKIKEELHCN